MSQYMDDFTEIPLDKLDILLQISSELSLDPLSCIEGEKYCLELLGKYQDRNDDDLKQLLTSAIAKDFQAIDKKPDWIQNSEWPFDNGKPMTFIGQLDIKRDKIWLHDDVAFYVFWNRETGITKTIIQIA